MTQEIRSETINGTTYDVSFNGNPIAGLSPIRYRAVIRSEKYSGGNPEVDAALASELSRDAKITAGEAYRECPEVVVEHHLDLRFAEKNGGPAPEDVIPPNPEPTHIRWVMVRKLSGNYTIADKKIRDIYVDKLGTAHLWTQE